MVKKVTVFEVILTVKDVLVCQILSPVEVAGLTFSELKELVKVKESKR